MLKRNNLEGVVFLECVQDMVQIYSPGKIGSEIFLCMSEMFVRIVPFVGGEAVLFYGFLTYCFCVVYFFLYQIDIEEY